MKRPQNVRYMQFFSTVSASLLFSTAIVYVTWASPAIPKLLAEDSPLGELTLSEQSWIASSFLLGNMVGCACSGFFLETFGRKRTMLIAALPLLVPWIVTGFTTSVIVVILVRAVAGFAGGLASGAIPAYIGEIAEKDIRGLLGLACNLVMNIVGFLVLSIGPIVSFRTLNLLCVIFPTLFLLTCFFIPESPYYLIKKNRKAAARASLTLLASNGRSEESIEGYLEEIQRVVENDMKNKSSLWEFLSKPDYRTSLIVIMGIQSLQQLNGLAGVVSYMQIIIESTDSSISAETSSIIFGIVPVAAALISTVLVDKMGRKPILMISAVGCALSIASLGLYFYLQDVSKANLDGVRWLPTTSITVYLLMDHLGIFTLPFVLQGELFATNIKGMAIAWASVYAAVLTFTVVKLFQPIVDAWGFYTMFWIYAGFCILGAAFVLLAVPETKGKTFTEIQEKLNRHRRK